MAEKDIIKVQEVILKIQATYRLMLKKWLLILVFSGIGCAFGLFYSINQKSQYGSSLSFVVEGEAAGGGLASIASTFGLGKGTGGQGVFSAANILDLLKSRSLVEKTLLQPVPGKSKKTFADLYIDFKGWRENWEDEPKLKNIGFKPESDPKELTLEQNEILGQIFAVIVESELKIEIRNPDNTIIYIGLTSENEDFVRYFPESLIKVVSEYYIESKTHKAKLNYQVLKQQTDSVRQELNDAITGVASANDNTFLLNPAFNIKRVPSVHKEVSVQANQAILTELVKNLELARMNLLNETPFISIIDTPVSPLKPKKMGKLKGIIIGGFLGSFLIIAFLILRNYLQNLFNPKPLSN